MAITFKDLKCGAFFKGEEGISLLQKLTTESYVVINLYKNLNKFPTMVKEETVLSPFNADFTVNMLMNWRVVEIDINELK